MNNRIRIPVYIVLVILAGISGYFALTNFRSMMNRAADRNAGVDQIEPERKPVEEGTAVLDPGTNAASGGTNGAAQAAATATNANGTATATNTNSMEAAEST